jgi:4-diphosphocytidyl-2-C-methyl-D-erythritol kinase
MTSAPLVPAPVTVRVPAKVNLELLVGPRRPDGYHALSTVFQAVSLYDDVTVAAAEDWGVTVSGPLAAGVPEDGDNLAMRAARLVEAHFDIDPVHIAIRKGIPVAGGMAGGSADAAATLVALDHLWDLDLDREELEDLASELGSDVPFLIAGGTAMGSGRGELLAPVLARGTYHWVFVLAEGGLSTPAVYAECDRLRADEDVPDPAPTAALMSALRTATPTSSPHSCPTTSRRRHCRCVPTSPRCWPRAWSTEPSAASSPAPARRRPSSSRTTRPASTSPSRSRPAASCATCGAPAARSTAPT